VPGLLRPRYLYAANAVRPIVAGHFTRARANGLELGITRLNSADRWQTGLEHGKRRNARSEGVIDKRFLLLSDVAEVLNISAAQTYALVRSGELPAIKVGGRGQWRVESQVLETYIQDAYTRTREFVSAHPFGPADLVGAVDDDSTEGTG
jgi:excisionase family DNA binding protein